MSGDEGKTASDEEMRKLLKPDPSNEQVVDALQSGHDQSFKIIKELDSYDDKNYLVEADDGTQYLAKVHNGVESIDFFKNGKDSSIFFQNAMMEHLSKHSIPTSAPVVSEKTKNSISGASLPVVSSQHSPQELVVRLLRWVPGRPMSSLPSLPMESLLDAGRFLGNLDSKLDLMDDFKAAHRYHAWDGKNTLDLRAYTLCIADERRRTMVESVLDAFQHEIVDKKVPFRTGILQADFNDANILVDQDSKVSGVIDFGDSVQSWRVLDISVAMAYATMSAYGKNGRSISAASAMLRGYNTVYPLQDIELQHLHLLMTCRVACSATLGAYSFQQNPENTYLLLHAEPAWKTLELVWGYDAERRVAAKAAIDRMFDKACSNNGESAYSCTDIALPDPFIVDVMSDVREETNGTVPPPSVKRQKTDDEKPILTFVTGNKKKLEEVKRILGGDGDVVDLPFVISNRKVDLPELQGDSIDIAKEKCSAAARQVGGPVITEDTSLCFTALSGLPGPYIKWFLESCGHEGLNNMIAFSDDKSAYAQTLVAFCAGPGKDVVVFDGRTNGTIVPARGSLDFGWDPIFQPNEGEGLTYAEMTKAGKDAISHRSRAFSQLRDYLSKEKEVIKAM